MGTIPNPYSFFTLITQLDDDPTTPSFELVLDDTPNSSSFVDSPTGNNNPSFEIWATFVEASTALAKIEFEALLFLDCTQITLETTRP